LGQAAESGQRQRWLWHEGYGILDLTRYRIAIYFLPMKKECGQAGFSTANGREWTRMDANAHEEGRSAKSANLPNEANFSDCVDFGNRLYHKLLDGRVRHIVTWLRFGRFACARWQEWGCFEAMNDGVSGPLCWRQLNGGGTRLEMCWEEVSGRTVAAMRRGGQGIRLVWAGLSSGTLDLQE